MDVYKKLQQHLDKMPIGFPATASGVELKLLKLLFTPKQAEIALGLNYKFRTVEQIHEHLNKSTMSLMDLEAILERMVERGNIYGKTKDGVRVFANTPLVIGMFEFQGARLTLKLLKNINKYIAEGFRTAYVSTKVSQSRVIPIGKSIRAEHRVGTYDELKLLIEGAGDRIRIGKCICRSAMDKAWQWCATTSRRETCMAFRDFADMMGKQGWGREVSKEEALEIALKNEEDGLVIQPANTQEPEFICACCGDCCGILRIVKAIPRPVDVLVSNFYVRVNTDICQGCGTCVDRCHMEAVSLKNKVAFINRDRCIGCGVCVPTCPSEARALVKKEKETVPPKDVEALYESMMERKR